MNSTGQSLIPGKPALEARRFSNRQIALALEAGWRTFRAIPGPSMAFATIFAAIGLLLLAAVGGFGISPMALPFAGGFMLVGPVLLSGFFRLSVLQSEGGQPRLSDAFFAFALAPAGVWVLALLCAFLFLVWITDAAVLYAVMIGGDYLPYELPWVINLRGQVIAFELWGAFMGSVIAFVILAVSAFSVPLLHERRANLIEAIHASVAAVFANFLSSIAWGLLLTAVILVSILLLPLLTVTLPTLAYASFSLYRQVYPLGESS